MNFPQLNPFANAIKKYAHQLLPGKYNAEIDETLERVAKALATQRDTENFMRLLGELYSAGYNTAIDSTREALKSRGLHLKLTTPVELTKSPVSS